MIRMRKGNASPIDKVIYDKYKNDIGCYGMLLLRYVNQDQNLTTATEANLE